MEADLHTLLAIIGEQTVKIKLLEAQLAEQPAETEDPDE